MKLKDLLTMDAQDLKNLDSRLILSEIQKQPDILIIGVLLLVTVFISGREFLGNRAEIKRLRNEAGLLVSKQDSINAFNDAQQLLDAYLADVPEPISDKDFVNRITDFAQQNRVAIQTYTPARKKEYPYYDLLSVRLTVQAKTYKELAKFVQAIEESNANMRVEYWDAELIIPNRVRGQEPNPNGMEIDPAQLYFQSNVEIALINISHG